MKRHLLAVFPLLAACGGAVATPTSTTTSAPVTGDSYGTIFAQINEFGENGKPGHQLGADVWTPKPAAAPCDGATLSKGACCYVPPSPPAPVPAAGGPAGATADGSPAYTMADLGALTLTDTTANTTIGTNAYGPGPAGFGYGVGYGTEEFGPDAWQGGDTLDLDATGPTSGAAFHARVVAVDLPTAAIPTRVPSSGSMTIVWTPHLDAKTMRVTLEGWDPSSATYPGTSAHESHGTVSCATDEADGTMTVDASLLAAFHLGDTVTGTMTAENVTPVQVGNDEVVFAAQGQRRFDVPFE